MSCSVIIKLYYEYELRYIVSGALLGITQASLRGSFANVCLLNDPFSQGVCQQKQIVFGYYYRGDKDGG